MKTLGTIFFLALSFTLLLNSCKSGGRQAGHQEKVDRFHMEKEVK
jgi:hypothetical protein